MSAGNTISPVIFMITGTAVQHGTAGGGGGGSGGETPRPAILTDTHV